ncbi:hypothetical protein L1887_18619 [Cichorium endivia]|nr:hypothetical protein L1887_18619 [Cichorium endivia]
MNFRVSTESDRSGAQTVVSRQVANDGDTGRRRRNELNEGRRGAVEGRRSVGGNCCEIRGFLYREMRKAFVWRE